MTKKSTIAKLLAEEDIHVVHKRAETASFNVATRELVIPIFKDEISNDLYDLFVCHEVAHALWTPLDMLDAIHEQGIDKSIVNVLEDARIEKMFMDKYPGSVRNFKAGYKELVEKDFFGIANKDLSKLNIIDKINIFYKTGLGEFTAEEKVLIDAVGQLKTPEDVISLAAKLCEYAKEQQEEEQMQQQQGASGNSNDEQEGEKEESQSNGSGQEGDQQEKQDTSGSGLEEGQDDQDDQQGSSSTSEQGQDDAEKSAGDRVGTNDAGKSNNDGQLKASTDSSYQKAMNSHSNKEARDRTYVRLPKRVDLKKMIMGYREYEALVKEIYTCNHDGEFAAKVSEKYQQIFNENKKAVSYMVKEFEMKKSADQYKRASISKTGTLDMNKLHTYQYNEDLFAKMTTIPGATNHGMIMFLDWSGSMVENIDYTMKQLFNLVWFCQRVKIPYQVLAFTDRMKNQPEEYAEPKLGEYNFGDFRLLELFTHKQTKQQSQFIMETMISMIANWTGRGFNVWKEWGSWPTSIPSAINLGGTPLNTAILNAHRIGTQFQKENKVQKLNFVFLTDGDSNGHSDYWVLREGYDGETIMWSGGQSDYNDKHITDPVTGAKVVIKATGRRDQTKVFLSLLKQQMPDASITGFFIAGHGRKGNVPVQVIESKFGLGRFSDKEKIVAIQKELRDNKVAVCTQEGYDEYYILPRGEHAVEGELEFKENMRAAGMAREFMKHTSKRTLNRQLLNKFIQKVA